MRSWTRTVRGIWRSGLRVEALALLSAAREERVRHPLGRFGRGEGLLDVKERGEQDARDRLSMFIGCQLTWRPARRFLTKVLRTCRRSGLRTGPGLSELSALTQVRRAGLLPIRFQPFRRPRRSAGRSDQTGALPNTPGPPNWPQASRARGCVTPAAGAVPVPP